MIVSHRRVGKAVEIGKTLNIVPDMLQIGVENMGTVLVYLDSLDFFRVYIARDMGSLVDYQHLFAGIGCLAGKNSSVKACSHNQIVIHFAHPSLLLLPSARISTGSPLTSS